MKTVSDDFVRKVKFKNINKFFFYKENIENKNSDFKQLELKFKI